MVRKFSPLIQTTSTEPPLLRPAVFSPRTRFTASAVSVSLTCVTLTLKRRSASCAAHCR